MTTGGTPVLGNLHIILYPQLEVHPQILAKLADDHHNNMGILSTSLGLAINYCGAKTILLWIKASDFVELICVKTCQNDSFGAFLSANHPTTIWDYSFKLVSVR